MGESKSERDETRELTQTGIVMKLIYTLSQIGAYNISDVNIVEGYFYMLEYAKQMQKEKEALSGKKIEKL